MISGGLYSTARRRADLLHCGISVTSPAGSTLDAEAARHCAEQVRRYDHDRYLCTLFAPAHARDAILALYAFNVEIAKVRETISEPMMGQIRLQWWREVVENAPRGDLRRHPVALALGAVIRGYDLPPAPFERLLDARERDLLDEPPETLAALKGYAEATAATLIDLALAVLGVRDAVAREAARHVGIAWALTGLLRAVPVHAMRQQVFLPAELTRAAGLDVARMLDGKPDDALRAVAQRIAEAARAHVEAARTLRDRVPRAAVPALLPAVLATHYLKRLERGGFSLFDAEAQRPPGDRAVRLLWAALRRRY
jgi:NADH dehydrogenase [ubiquinone] 1 alpha subcomplex assembly factor 6